MKQHDRDFTNKMFNVRENNVSNNNKVNYKKSCENYAIISRK